MNMTVLSIKAAQAGLCLRDGQILTSFNWDFTGLNRTGQDWTRLDFNCNKYLQFSRNWKENNDDDNKKSNLQKVALVRAQP